MANILLSGSIGVAGSVSILGSASVSFTTDADHTLTATEYSNQFLSVSSSVPLTTTRKLIAPINAGQTFIVQNNTTGSQSITVIGATGTGVTITPGSTTFVSCDGTNYLSPGATASGGTAANLFTNSGVVNVSNAAAPSSGQVLTATGATTAVWQSPAQFITALTGDVTASGSGSVPATVVRINGATVPAAGALTTSNVLQVSGSSALTYALIANANVSAAAAIAGTKITPAFGTQNISTTGTLAAGNTTITGTASVSSTFSSGTHTVSGAINATGGVHAANVVSDGYAQVSGTSGPTITAGTGAPVSTPAAGSLFLRTDGAASNGLYVYEAGSWTPLGAAGAGGPPSGSAGGDLGGNYPTPSVVAINGTTVPASPSANQVLVANSSTSAVWSQIIDGYVSASAAIAGSKISPNFGSQNVQTTGLYLGGANPSTTSTILASTTIPSTGDTFYALNTASNNLSSRLVTGGASLVSAWEAWNTASGASSSIGIRLMAAGVSASVADWDGNGIIEQVGASTSALVFSKFQGNATNRGTTGRIFQTGAWGVGSGSTNNTSSAAQAGLTGPLISLATATGTLTSTTNQATISNIAGVLTLQGQSGVSTVVGTTVAVTYTTGGIQTSSIGIGAGSPPPTITSGLGTPGSAPSNGSLYMRTDGSASTGLYTYQSGVWQTIGITYGTDLLGSTSTNQYIASISGSGGTGGTVPFHALGLQWDGYQGAPLISQQILGGTGVNDGYTFTVQAQQGRAQSGANNNNNGGNLVLKSGSAGTGGSGTAGKPGNVLLQTDGTTQVTVSNSAVGFNQALSGMTGGALKLNSLLITMSDADYTLSSTDMTFPIIEFLGTLTANRSILCPTQNGAAYIISNKTTGGFSLTVHRADGGDGGVTIGDGYNALVFYDGVNDNSYEVAVSATGGGGGGGTNTVTNVIMNPIPPWSASDYLPQNGTAALGTSNLTTALGFTVQNPVTVVGVKFYWAGSSALTVKASLWDDAGTRVAFGTIAVSTAGIYTCNFNTAYALANSHRDKQFYVSVWENTGTDYTKVTQSSTSNIPALPFIAGQYYTITSLATNSVGDTLPNTVSGTEYYPLEPVFSGVYGVAVHTPNVTSNYTIVATDQFIPVDTTGSVVTISAPLNPVLGQQFTVQDVGGNAGTNNITIAGNGINILSPGGSVTSVTISSNYSSAVFTYNGSTWSLGISSIQMIPERITMVAGIGSVSGTTYTVVGGTSLDLSNYPATANGRTRTIYFGGDFSVPINTDTASIRLWDAVNGVAITGTTFTTTNTTPTRFLSSALTVGASNGNIRTDIICQYQVQLAMTGGSTTDKAICYNAHFVIKYQ